VLAAEAGDFGWVTELLDRGGAGAAGGTGAVHRERADEAAEGLRAAVERGLLAAGVVWGCGSRTAARGGWGWWGSS
jgi:hypothetical protein